VDVDSRSSIISSSSSPCPWLLRRNCTSAAPPKTRLKADMAPIRLELTTKVPFVSCPTAIVEEEDDTLPRLLESTLGASDGRKDESSLGFSVGSLEGNCDGRFEGFELGSIDGRLLGANDGLLLGSFDGRVDGLLLGRVEGRVEGLLLGTFDGKLDGLAVVGAAEGFIDRLPLGASDGAPVGKEVVSFFDDFFDDFFDCAGDCVGNPLSFEDFWLAKSDLLSLVDFEG